MAGITPEKLQESLAIIKEFASGEEITHSEIATVFITVTPLLKELERLQELNVMIKEKFGKSES